MNTSITPLPATLAPHQLRVVEEKRDLDDKLSKLTAFLGSGKCLSIVGPDECLRLIQQSRLMRGYSAILAARIAAFEVSHA